LAAWGRGWRKEERRRRRWQQREIEEGAIALFFLD
jgi:hypothetical protein